MYNLTNKAIKELESNQDLRFAVAKAMGNNEDSIRRSLKRTNGKAIAEHYDAMNVLLDKTGLIMSELRKPISESETKETA